MTDLKAVADTILTISVGQLIRAFDLWETECRADPENFRSAEELAEIPQDRAVMERAIALTKYLESAK